jgi:hypothetical protein
MSLHRAEQPKVILLSNTPQALVTSPAATIFQEEQGLQLVLAVLRSRYPEPLCPGHSVRNSGQKTGKEIP